MCCRASSTAPTAGRASLAVHLAPGETAATARQAIAALRPADDRPAGALPLPFMRRDDPDRADWGRMLRWALGAFGTGALDKVVLARRARFLFETGVDAFDLLERLEAATPRCYHALVAPRADLAFLTATPERLLRLDGRTLRTEAVAGTRPRSEADADDDRLRDELLASEKDQREHGYVRRAIEAALAPLAESVTVDDQGPRHDAGPGPTPPHRHRGHAALQRRRARRAPGAPPDAGRRRDAHAGRTRRHRPAGAVRPRPLRRPRRLDRARRRRARSRRSGPSASARAWSTGARSRSTPAAGIVDGSDADAEWAEIEHKIGDFARRVLGLTVRAEA